MLKLKECDGREVVFECLVQVERDGNVVMLTTRRPSDGVYKSVTWSSAAVRAQDELAVETACLETAVRLGDLIKRYLFGDARAARERGTIRYGPKVVCGCTNITSPT